MAEIRYTFTASGQDQVVSAFQSIDTAAQRTARSVDRSYSHMGRTAQRTAQQQAQSAQRLSTRVTNAAQMLAAKSSGRAMVNQYRSTQDAIRRETKKTTGVIKSESQKQAQAQEKAMRQVWRRKRRFTLRGTMGGAGIRIGLGAVAGAGGAAGALMGSAARQSIQLEDLSTSLYVKAAQRGGITSGTQLRRGFEETAMSNPGVRATDVAASVGAFIKKTGNLGAATGFQNTFAQVGLASGANLKDIGLAAADLFEKFDVTSIDDMSKALSTLYVQGKKGAFELEDAARQFPRIAAAAAVFGIGKGQKGVATLGGLTQIARSATGTGPQAATAVENMFRDLVDRADKVFSTTGARVFTDSTKTQTRDITDVLVDIIKGTGGDISKLSDVFNRRSIRAVQPLMKVFADAVRSGKSMAEAQQMVRDKINSAINVIDAEKKVREDAATMSKTTSNTMTAAWENIKKVVGEEFAPQMTKMAKQLAKFVTETDVINKLAKGFSAVAEGAEAAAQWLHKIGVLGDRDPSKAKARERAKKLGGAQAAINALGLTDKQKKAFAEYSNMLGGVAPSRAGFRAFMEQRGLTNQSYTRFTEFSEQNEILKADRRKNMKGRLDTWHGRVEDPRYAKGQLVGKFGYSQFAANTIVDRLASGNYREAALDEMLSGNLVVGKRTGITRPRIVTPFGSEDKVNPEVVKLLRQVGAGGFEAKYTTRGGPGTEGFDAKMSGIAGQIVAGGLTVQDALNEVAKAIKASGRNFSGGGDVFGDPE